MNDSNLYKTHRKSYIRWSIHAGFVAGSSENEVVLCTGELLSCLNHATFCVPRKRKQLKWQIYCHDYLLVLSYNAII